MIVEPDRIISVNGLTIQFGGAEPFTAVNNISFSIDKGKTLAIVGESGSGKSLTALALMGLLPAAASMAGDIIFNSNTAEGFVLQIAKMRGKNIGMVFQEPMSSLNPVMSIGKQLKEAILVHQDIKNAKAKLLAIDWLGKVQLSEPEIMYTRFPHQLSGGQKQRVMIAMAMCNHPSLLIADEPTTALDVTVQQEILRLMCYLQQEHGTAMVFITHDLGVAAEIADDVMVMHKGVMMEYGATNEVLANPKTDYTRALIACRPSAASKGARLQVVADFAGQEHKEPPKPVLYTQNDADKTTTSLLTVNHLKVWFPGKTNLRGQPLSFYKAVDDVSFTINRGEVLGLVGESGCGKSTISKSIMGLVAVNEGEIVYNNRDIIKYTHKEWRSVRRDIQMIFQDPYSSLNPRMTIGDILREPLMVHGIVPTQDLEKEVYRLLDIVQLPQDAYGRYPHQFSGGQRQRIGIARALALRPKLLICDESVSALDVSIQAQILNLLKDLQNEFGLTYLFISHDLNVVHYISDRVMVMQAGKIVETGEAGQVLKYPKEAYTQQLVAAMV